jgi:MFS family permease
MPLPSLRDVPRRAAEDLARFWRLIIFVFLPFAAGLYLTYLFRTINALISGELASDLALGAADLGLLTAVYFLSISAFQIPIGVMLDRYGPRRVQSALLLIAAAGAALFAESDRFATLVFARALIGLGVAAALTAGLKALVLWFPRERIATFNGYLLMFGALGAITATAPAELLVADIGWRGLFELLAAATATIAVTIYLAVPEPQSTASAFKRSADVGLTTIYRDARFWRLAPLSATCVGSAWALQGLWAAPWLTDVEGVDRSGLIRHLFVMAVAVGAGAILLGTATDRLARQGFGPDRLMAIVAATFMATQLALILQLPVPSYLAWFVVAAVGAATVLSHATVVQYFPAELAGRATGALNIFHFGGAFILQLAIGVVLQQWTPEHGHYPTRAYQIAFGAIVVLQVLALVWFELPRAQRLWTAHSSSPRRKVVDHIGSALRSRTPYRRATRIWTRRVESAFAQSQKWQAAAIGSTILSGLLACALALSSNRSSIVPYVVDLSRVEQARASDPTIQSFR